MASVLIVERRESNQTISAFLRSRLQLPWSKAKQLVFDGRIKVAGQKITDVGFRLKPGKQVLILEPEGSKRKGKSTLPKKTTRAEKPNEATPLPTPEIVYQDDDLVVVNKAAGLTTMRHAEEADEFGERGKKFLPKTLMDLLPPVLNLPRKAIRAVHRIDRDTTGLVVFALNQATEKKLTELFRKHTIERRYLALVRGTPKAGRIESHLIRDRGDGRRGSSSTPEEGQRAITHVRILKELGDITLVECRLETGRTHQVRIHLGEMGTPLCGERIYDRPLHGKPYPDPSHATRPLLHATLLGFHHPSHDDWMEWSCPMPQDMQMILPTE